MRKHTTMASLPQRDPRHYRFSVPNEVWAYKLRPVEFVILAYLYCSHTQGKGDEVCTEVRARSLRLTTTTVQKHLTALVSRGIVNVSGVPALTCGTGNFFSLPNEVFLLSLPPSAFVVYAYLLYCENRRSHQCHPSCRTIASAAGLSVNTVVKAIGILTEKELIAVARSCWFNAQGQKRNGNNVYTILSTRMALEQFYQQQMEDWDQQSVQLRAKQLLKSLPPVCPAATPYAPSGHMDG